MPGISAVVRRLEAVIKARGQQLTLTPSGGGAGTSFHGRVSILNLTALYPRFTSAETSTWQRPAYQITIAGNFAPPSLAVGATVILSDGLTYTLRKWDKPQEGGTVVKTVLYVART